MKPVRSVTSAFAGVDHLAHAVAYLSHHFSVKLSGAEAQANVDARALLLRLEEECLDEAHELLAR